jgi:hypothetical protein
MQKLFTYYSKASVLRRLKTFSPVIAGVGLYGTILSAETLMGVNHCSGSVNFKVFDDLKSVIEISLGRVVNKPFTKLRLIPTQDVLKISLGVGLASTITATVITIVGLPLFVPLVVADICCTTYHLCNN